MNQKQIKILTVVVVTAFVLPALGFVAFNRQELAEAFRVDKSAGKLLYFYVPC